MPAAGRKVDITIKRLDSTSEELVTLVARRMRATLVEVLGRTRGASMYTLDWLRERVRFHLDPDARRAAVLLAYDGAGTVVGHTLLRIETESNGTVLGLVSTIHVVRSRRRNGVASRLLEEGEMWLIARGAATLATDTDENNMPLRRLYEKCGYGIAFRDSKSKMIRLAREVGEGNAELQT